MNAKRKTGAAYFTLLEIMVAMGVFGILMLALMQFFNAAQNVWTTSANNVAKIEAASAAMSLIAADLQNAYYEAGRDAGWNKHFFAVAQYIDSTPPLNVCYSKTAFATIRPIKEKDAVSRITEVFYRHSGNVLETNTLHDKAALPSGFWCCVSAPSPITTLAGSPFQYLNRQGVQKDENGKTDVNSPSVYNTFKWKVVMKNVLRFYLRFSGTNPSNSTQMKWGLSADELGSSEKSTNPLSNFTYCPNFAEITLVVIDGDTAKRIRALLGSAGVSDPSQIVLSNFLKENKNEPREEDDDGWIGSPTESQKALWKNSVRPLLLDKIQTFTRTVVIDRSVN